MDESKLIDWYDVIESVANGRTDNLTCPSCGHQGLEISEESHQTRVRCPQCGEGLMARGGGRDDAYDREAVAMMRRQAQARRRPASGPLDDGLCPPLPEDGGLARPGQPPRPRPASSPAKPAPVKARASFYADPPAGPPPRRGEPWSWQLPHQGGEPDPEALALWMPLIESIHNGRRTGLQCPFCSEPLHDIHHQPPHLRIVCRQCGEAFEGRVG